MRKTVYKGFWAWDFDKEEAWLNQMAAQGYCLTSVGFFQYTFESCLPGEYGVRLELLENVPSHPESAQYIAFLEETGAEYLGCVIRWAYFRKKTADGPFSLYSDNASRVKHLNRLLLLLGVLALSQFCIALSNLSAFFGSGHTASLMGGLVCLSAALLLGYGYLRTRRKKSLLKKEQQLFE